MLGIRRIKLIKRCIEEIPEFSLSRRSQYKVVCELIDITNRNHNVQKSLKKLKETINGKTS